MAKFSSGSFLVAGLIGFAAVFGLAFWWSQQHAFLEEIQADEVIIAGKAFPVAEWQGVDSDSSPLKLRACFVLPGQVDAPTAPAPEPLVGPGWFECFDAKTIGDALARDEARAYLAAADEPHGFDRIVAVFPGGQAFMWRQLNGKIAE